MLAISMGCFDGITWEFHWACTLLIENFLALIFFEFHKSFLSFLIVQQFIASADTSFISTESVLWKHIDSALCAKTRLRWFLKTCWWHVWACAVLLSSILSFETVFDYWDYFIVVFVIDIWIDVKWGVCLQKLV